MPCSFRGSASCSPLCSLCQFVDYQNYIRNCCMKDIPVMERSIALCNGISQWVQLMVLSRPTAQLRAEVFTKFIHVAQVVVSSTPPICHSVSDPVLVKKKNTLYTLPLFLQLHAALKKKTLHPINEMLQGFTVRQGRSNRSDPVRQCL